MVRAKSSVIVYNDFDQRLGLCRRQIVAQFIRWKLKECIGHSIWFAIVRDGDRTLAIPQHTLTNVTQVVLPPIPYRAPRRRRAAPEVRRG